MLKFFVDEIIIADLQNTHFTMIFETEILAKLN